MAASGLKRWLLACAVAVTVSNASALMPGAEAAGRYAPQLHGTLFTANPTFTVSDAGIDPSASIQITVSPAPTIEFQGRAGTRAWSVLRARALRPGSHAFVATETVALPPGTWYWQWAYGTSSCASSVGGARHGCHPSRGTHCDAVSAECTGPVLSFSVESPAAGGLAASGFTGQTTTFATGYPGNEVVEPSILYDSRAPFFADSSGKNGYEYVMCLGGYPQSNAIYENPNLWVSHDGTNWTYAVFTNGTGVPTLGYSGVLTPIVPNDSQGDGNLSDPYLTRGPDGTYYILYNQFLDPVGAGGTGAGGANWSIKGISSTSLAGPWSAPVTLVTSTLASSRPSSPSALWDGTGWQVYGVDNHDTSNTAVYRYTVAGTSLLGQWTPQPNLSIGLPAGYSSQVWWHLNAYSLAGTQYILMQDSAAGTSGGGNLWLLDSTDDGATWIMPPQPVLAGSSFYRGALVPRYRGHELGFDLFYGVVASNWSIGRGFVSLGPS